MKTYQIIAFDLDGTLTEPSAGIVASFKYAHEKMGIKYSSEEDLKKFIGPPIRDVWTKTYGLSNEQAELAVKYFREYFSEYGWWNNVLFDGVHEMLKTLKSRGKKLILATSKPEKFAIKIMEKFDIAKYFDFLGGASLDGSRDTKESVLSYALSSIGVNTDKEKQSAILVGDRFYDAVGAKACNIDSLGVLYGHGSMQEINSCGFNYVVKTVNEICDILK